MSPEDFDIEEYLSQVKRRWQSAMLSEEKNKEIRDKWDERYQTTSESDIPSGED